jgi:serine/threonine protein kinase
MTARHRVGGYEVAVKFIIKDKIPVYAYLEDPVMGRIPTEIFLLAALEHENIVKCMDLFEDELYYYMIQELHGSPWQDHQGVFCDRLTLSPFSSEVPELSPSTSAISIESAPPSPPTTSCTIFTPSSRHASEAALLDQTDVEQVRCSGEPTHSSTLCLPSVPRPNVARRASHDLFEFIETSQDKRLSENNARPVFAQVVEAVHYLDSLGICHRDIKDENILIDRYGKVKLIDFGSASVADPAQPRPFYDSFFGTTAYAASEILQKKSYQAAPAEVWTLGVLLSYLLTGASPFPTEKDAIRGRIRLAEIPGMQITPLALHLLRRCLEANPRKRATIAEVRSHPWLLKH